jgi:small GTP-binding protein
MKCDRVIHIYELDLAILLSQVAEPSAHYVNAKVVLVGDTGVGKTGLSLVLNNQPFEATDSTPGRRVWALDSREVSIGGNVTQTRETLLWDLAGQPQFRIVRPLYYRGSAGAVFMFDVTMPHTLARIEDWVSECHNVISGAPGVLIGNKIDLKDKRLVDRSTAEARASRLGLRYFETSAKLGQNIDAPLMWLLAEILKR